MEGNETSLGGLGSVSGGIPSEHFSSISLGSLFVGRLVRQGVD